MSSESSDQNKRETHKICIDCFRKILKDREIKKPVYGGPLKIICSWCNKVLYDPNKTDKQRRNPDNQLRQLEAKYAATKEPQLRRQINISRQRAGLEPLRKPKEWGGYIKHWVSPKTGTLIVLTTARGLDLERQHGRYALVCDEHSNFYQDNVITDEMNTPEDWCENCRLEARGAPQHDIFSHWPNLKNLADNI